MDDLIKHKIKMVIFANQTLRVGYESLTRLLQQMKSVNSLDEITEKMASMEDIFKLQEMYQIKNKEKELEEKLQRLGY